MEKTSCRNTYIKTDFIFFLKRPSDFVHRLIHYSQSWCVLKRRDSNFDVMDYFTICLPGVDSISRDTLSVWTRFASFVFRLGYEANGANAVYNSHRFSTVQPAWVCLDEWKKKKGTQIQSTILSFSNTTPPSNVRPRPLPNPWCSEERDCHHWNKWNKTLQGVQRLLELHHTTPSLLTFQKRHIPTSCFIPYVICFHSVLYIIN